MKTNLLMYVWLLGVLLIGACSQNDNEFSAVDDKEPVAVIINTIASEAGRSFTIEGTITDADGIRSICLQNDLLSLNKTIDLVEIYKEVLTEYELSYVFDSPDDAAVTDVFIIHVTITDVVGNVTETDVTVLMNGDFTAPVFTTVPSAAITVLMKDNTKFKLNIAARDDKALDYAEVSIPDIAYSKIIQADGTELQYQEYIELPSEIKNYQMTITVVDKSGLEISQETVISVSEMPDFATMYLTDVAEAGLLNSDVFGVPMLIEHTGEFTYRGRYYNQTAGTEIFFIPQKTDFSPICFGLDPEDSSLLTDDPDSSQPIVLNEANVYYDIAFNVKTGAFSIATYVVSEASNKMPYAIGDDFLLDAAQPDYSSVFKIGLVGTGMPDNNAWSPSTITELTQNPLNPNHFYVDMYIASGTHVEFVIHNKHDWGWWDLCFWRFDSKEEPESCVWKGGNNFDGDMTQSGTYRFEFDAHLERAKFYIKD